MSIDHWYIGEMTEGQAMSEQVPRGALVANITMRATRRQLEFCSAYVSGHVDVHTFGRVSVAWLSERCAMSLEALSAAAATDYELVVAVDNEDRTMFVGGGAVRPMGLERTQLSLMGIAAVINAPEVVDQVDFARTWRRRIDINTREQMRRAYPLEESGRLIGALLVVTFR